MNKEYLGLIPIIVTVILLPPFASFYFIVGLLFAIFVELRKIRNDKRIAIVQDGVVVGQGTKEK